MKLSTFRRMLAQTAISTGFLVASAGAFAADNQDEFWTFKETVVGWAQGPLGVGLAVLMLIVGAGIGVAKNSPMPALSGIAAAAILHWGPGVITSMMGTGALI